MSEAVPTENLRVRAMTATPPRVVVPANRIKFTPAMVATVHEERARPSPTPWAKIARMIGVSTGTLYGWADRAGIDTSVRAARPPRDPAADARLRELWADATVSKAAIGRELGGIERATVNRRAIRLRLGPKPALLQPSTPRPRVRRPDEWPEADDAKLRELWSDGLSCALIGKRMHRTKGAIIGRSHRLELPPRVSPVREKRQARTSEKRKVRTSPRPAENPQPSERRECGTGLLIGPTLPPLALPAVRIVSLPPVGPVSSCCWPLWGDRERATGLYCGDPSVAGRSYCGLHMALAYTPTRRQEIANAA